MGKGGGSPAPAPTSQSVTQTSIPEYARPYVENMLGKSEALTDINANPYQAYGGQRIQDFTPMQQQAFQGVGNMQVSPEIGAGSGMAALAGLGSLGAGSNYMNMATDPRATQAFMSPYMQNVVDTQKNEAFRDYQKGLTGLNARATGAGAFGGSRQAIERAEAGRNLGTQLGNIQAQGSQNAFQAAQQAQQFGSQLGLQGLGQGLQAASTLGQLGQTGYGQRMGILGEQQKVGAVQQAQGQQGLDLAYQDFLKQKNYPYTQLAFQSDMLRGLPLSQSAQQIYTAPPNAASQLGGLGMAGLGIYGMSGGFKKDGGVINGYKDGGSIGYLGGGEIKSMTTEQLKALLESPNLNPIEQQMVEEALMMRRRMEMNPEAISMMAGRSGIGAIGTGDMVPEDQVMAAEGGIIAFAKGGSSNQAEYMKFLEDQVRDSYALMKDNTQFAKSDERMAQLEKESKERREAAPFAALARAGFKASAGKSPYALTNLGEAGEEGIAAYAKSMSDEAASDKLLLQQQVEAEKAKLARNAGLNTAATTSLGQMYTKQSALEAANAVREGTAAQTKKTAFEKAKYGFDKAISVEKQNLMKDKKNTFNYNQNPDQLENDATRNVIKRLSILDPSMLKDLNYNPDVIFPKDNATPAPAAANSNKPKVYTIPSAKAISALKSMEDQKLAMQQFDEMFGPGAAKKALGK